MCAAGVREEYHSLVRHKVLDLIGDMALTGWFWSGHLTAVKAGHPLHNDLARRVMAPAAPERMVSVD